MTVAQSKVQKRVLITGASSGIGEASAQAFAKAGFNVVLVARSQAKLTALATQLTALGIEASSFAIDLAEVAQVRARLDQVIAAAGPIDILINNAGMGYTGSLGEMPLADWQRVMALNVTSVFQVVQAVLPGMRSRAQGLIINIASIAAQQSFPNWGAYGVSKAALVALSGAIAAEESAHGIRVATLSLGAVNTPLWQSDTVQSDFEVSTMLSPHTVAQTILQMALLPPEAVISDMTLTPSQGAL
jgi:short-subunit dehydrogenase